MQEQWHEETIRKKAQMPDERTRFGKLAVNYAEDENSIHCTCDCGTKIIVSKDKLDDNSSCGCLHRIYLLSLVGAADEGSIMAANPTANLHEGRGINYDKKKEKWRARITYQSKEYHLGYFPDKEAAIEVRREAESNMGSDFIQWYTQYKNEKL